MSGNYGGSYQQIKATSTLEKPGGNGLESYELNKLNSRFFDFAWPQDSPGYTFDDWNNWRENDGFLCRNDTDCRWLGFNLECKPVGDFGWKINVSCLEYLAAKLVRDSKSEQLLLFFARMSQTHQHCSPLLNKNSKSGH